ncbi:MAG: hypothetical protein J3Q66DRAFT_129772 [Benniella sp.]|nr:MAG: hypothetical protein J3Q66DRAFT_129772 [Benniella sp.]
MSSSRSRSRPTTNLWIQHRNTYSTHRPGIQFGHWVASGTLAPRGSLGGYFSGVILVHHVRVDLLPAQLVKTFYIYSRNLDDLGLTSSIQIVC